MSLLIALFALMLLSAIGMGMMFSSQLETTIASNYRDKQQADYAALAGLEEARDRLQPASGDIATPADLPNTAAANVIYIINPRNGETIAPWDYSNTYHDTELCQENVMGVTAGTPGVPCSGSGSLPSTSTWYTTVDDSSGSGVYSQTSLAAQNQTPLSVKWTRVSLKADNMTPVAVTSSPSGSVVCWDGLNQIAQPAGYGKDCAPNGSLIITLKTQGSGYTSAPNVHIGPPPSGGTQAQATATVSLTPNGTIGGLTITSPGAGYTTAPTVTFAGGGGINAAATATVGNGGHAVTSLTGFNAGTACYSAAPAVTFNSGGVGSGAAATAVLSGTPDCIISLNITGSCSANKGTTQSLTLSGGSGFTGTVTYHNGTGQVASWAITTPGSGFSSVPTTGSDGTCTVAVSGSLGYRVASMNLTAGGSGYTSQPTVAFNSGLASPSGATVTLPSVTANLGPGGAAGTIVALTLTNAGSGYTSAPTVGFSGGGGAGATATATLGQSGSVTAITLNPAGTGYTSEPTVSITGGGGSGATAVATPSHGFHYGQVYLITSMAETPSNARSMAQMEAVTPVRGISITGALTLDGPSPNFTASNSNGMVVNGVDANTCSGAAQPAHPSIGVYDDPNNVTSPTAQSNVLNQINNQGGKPANYPGSAPTPDVENVYNSLGDTMGTVSGMEAYAAAIQAMAHAAGTDYYVNNPTIPATTASTPGVFYIDGDMSFPGAYHGYGILLVRGTLTMSGNFSWNGPILCIGEGNCQFSGGGSGQITGTVIVAKTLDSSGNLLSTLGAPQVAWPGGGGNGIAYDHCWADNLLATVPFTPPQSTKPLKVISTRTVSY